MARSKQQQKVTSYQISAITSRPDLPFDIHRARDIPSDESHLLDAHRHEFYTIALPNQGYSNHLVDFQPVKLQTGQVLCITPGQVHLPQSFAHSDGFMLAFTSDFLLPGVPIFVAGAPPLLQPSPEIFTRLLALAAEMELELLQKDKNYLTVLRHLLATMLTLLDRSVAAVDEPSLSRPAALLQQYRLLVEAHFLEWTSTQQYAQQLHVSRGHLNDIVKQHSGQTASALLAERRLLEAKRLLLYQEQQIKEIAYHLGFNELSYFNRFFRMHTGMTPQAFRVQARELYNHSPQ
ncbi:AraC family transcriptional regulator [Chitinophaga pendula]|uniref:helix-turn-helix domain-containing protein n=1 Tax=Chitinophaga TaxID=79328 RepID=UPI000BAEEA1B|nr:MULTISPECIES: AraC family transcriptional regulator [Chitinophaga]ASZ11117.1 hypothetical protein CK934_09155 [Chitinophaga sp. MD30]UCJ05886.1 AraC family transcriptional regulator [Chitinophaga pendula]